MIDRVIWNLGGQAIPLLFALFTTPFLIDRLGEERFGLLSISWIVIGYMSLFDFGLGRALTRQIAIKIGLGRLDEIPISFWSAIWVMLIMGALFLFLGVAGSSLLVTEVLNVPTDLQGEANTGLKILSLGIPITILSTALRGFIEAHQLFRIVGSLRFANGVSSFLLPSMIAIWTTNMGVIMGALVVARFAIAVGSYFVCVRMTPTLSHPLLPHLPELREMTRVGGWMTISNVISPLMTTLDRFVVGSIISVRAVTFYATPLDVITKVQIIPAAVTGVLFPHFSESLQHSGNTVSDTYRRSWNSIFLTLFPFVFASAIFAGPLLEIWLGVHFAERSARVLQWLAFGVLANGMALLPFTLLHAQGRSKSVAAIHIIELPLYVVALFALLDWQGITGAAIAWTGRVTFDLLALLLVSGGFRSGEGSLRGNSALLTQLFMVAVMAVGCLTPAGGIGTLLTVIVGACLMVNGMRRYYPMHSLRAKLRYRSAMPRDRTNSRV